MFRSIATLTAIVTSLVLAPVARAETVAANTSSANATWQALEANNPHSVEFKNGATGTALDANAAWAAAESGNPHSVDFANRNAGRASDANAAWAGAESGNPHAVRR